MNFPIQPKRKSEQRAFRDEVAILVLDKILTNDIETLFKVYKDGNGIELLAKISYSMADEMIKEKFRTTP